VLPASAWASSPPPFASLPVNRVARLLGRRNVKRGTELYYYNGLCTGDRPEPAGQIFSSRSTENLPTLLPTWRRRRSGTRASLAARPLRGGSELDNLVKTRWPWWMQLTVAKVLPILERERSERQMTVKNVYAHLSDQTHRPGASTQVRLGGSSAA